MVILAVYYIHAYQWSTEDFEISRFDDCLLSDSVIIFCFVVYFEVVCCSRRSSDKNYLYNTSHIQVTMFMTSLKCRTYERSRSTQVRIHVSKSLGHNFFTRILRSFVLYKNSYGCCFIKYKGCA